MKKQLAILTTIFLALIILTTTACTKPPENENAEAAKAKASQSAANQNALSSAQMGTDKNVIAAPTPTVTEQPPAATPPPTNKAYPASSANADKTNSSTGAIKVGSRPEGASVMLIADDGGFAGKPQMLGVSPTTIADLAPGKYTVHLELKGYKAFQKAVEVKAGETIPVTADLQR
jgi:hypothetical protein